jgi:alkanesulfonate monooxygenase SsuD/methylene tetrahydromethanopterin reductase-like flavin-dependent oxidoreductase (luciferase family)
VKLGITPWDLGHRGAAALSAQAALAEKLGYASFWLPESHFGANAIPEPLMLLAAVAAATKRIRLGTTSFLLPLRNPVQAAEQVAVLDQLSGGRVILGVGRGYAPPTLRAFQVDPREKRALFEEHLQFMLRAWAGEHLGLVTEGGEPLRLDPLPVQRPHPPVWVAAFGPKALVQAGSFGFPYLASPVESLDALERNHAEHRRASLAAGHPPPVEVPVMRTVFVTGSAAETAALRDRVQAETPRSGRLAPAGDVEGWTLIGEASYVREGVSEYRARLGVTHLIIARLRIGGVERARLERNVARVMEVLG